MRYMRCSYSQWKSDVPEDKPHRDLEFLFLGRNSSLNGGVYGNCSLMEINNDIKTLVFKGAGKLMYQEESWNN